MKVSSVIAEYNPFHYGHEYQLKKIKENTDAVIVIMSGPFVQRGEAAITDKWFRARAALNSGADLVLELPVIYALNTAQKFAYGAVSILDKLNIVNELVFGSECGNIEQLIEISGLLEHEPKQVSEKLQQYISDGLSYPAAREKAFSCLIPDGILSEPNNILALEYIRAVHQLNSNITVKTIKRIGSGYDDTDINGFASASGIRSRLMNNIDCSALMPYHDFNIYKTSELDTAVISKLRTMSADELSNINEVSEGLENRILKAALSCSDISEICTDVKTKRYTMSRIKRILLSSLLGLTKDLSDYEINYIRVLGLNKTGAALLKEIKQNSELDIITKASDYRGNSKAFNADIKAQNIFELCGGTKKGNTDFTVSPVIL